jgi:adenylate cyclase
VTLDLRRSSVGASQAYDDTLVMIMTKEVSNSSSEAPFPLKRYFFVGVLPGLLLVLASVVYATTQVVRSSTIEILLQLASHKVDGIAKEIELKAPNAWQRLLSGRPLAIGDLSDLTKALADEQRETQIPLLKIYNRDRKTVFATEPDEVGRVEDKPELRDALKLGTASVLVERDVQGGAFYELYLPYRSAGNIAAVFELYEPVSGFDAMVWKVIRPILIIPLSLSAIVLGGLAWLTVRAQTDINFRTNVIISLRQRLERLVSHRAVAAMRAPEAEHKAEMLDVTLFYSDVRGFTGFAEHQSPEKVIEFLNGIIGLQVEIIEARGGDIDKMIGDAVLARFHGRESAAHAIEAAVAVQNAIKCLKFPRGVAIGLYGGPVVAGLIGAGDRFDYTVVGDTVNIVARLCGLAKAGEVLVDSATAALVKKVSFGPEEVTSVRGRAGKLTVRRFQV